MIKKGMIMNETVYFIKSELNLSDDDLSIKLKETITNNNLIDYIESKDTIAIKTHFGEKKDLGYARPVYIKTIGELIKEKGALPFITETSTLYKGGRTNAIDHIALAHDHGFGFDQTNMPIIMLDGLYGDEETEIPIKGKIYNKVKVASLLTKCQSMIMVSHFTGHLLAGYGCALKNLGMGCASRKGKMAQHSTVKPKIKKKVCTKCAVCIKWCPEDAITMTDESAVIDKEKCIGCGECLAVCRFDAVSYNWGASHEDIQKMVVEHALGVTEAISNKILYINFLTRISKDCDCMGTYENIVPDIGILISYDPVAIDQASIDLVEKVSGKKLSDIAYNIPYNYQLDYTDEIGFGNRNYELKEI